MVLRHVSLYSAKSCRWVVYRCFERKRRARHRFVLSMLSILYNLIVFLGVDPTRYIGLCVFSYNKTRKSIVSDAESFLYHSMPRFSFGQTHRRVRTDDCFWRKRKHAETAEFSYNSVWCSDVRLTVGSVDRRCSTSGRRSSQSATTAATQLFGSGYISSPNYPARYRFLRQGSNVLTRFVGLFVG